MISFLIIKMLWKIFHSENKIFRAYKSDNFFAPPSNQRIVSDTSTTQKFDKMMAGDENFAHKDKISNEDLKFLVSDDLYER